MESIAPDQKSKIKIWLGQKENILLVAVLIFAIAIRLYYFGLTNNQPLWWDEGEYMLKAKNIALGTPETGWNANIRPILFPFLSAPFFFFGMGEAPIRLLMVFVSVAGIFFTYLIGKELFDKKVGIVGATLMSVFYIDIFYTTRLLVDVPQIFFVTLAGYLFVKNYFGGGEKRLIWFVLPAVFIGVQLRFTVGLMAGVLLLFLLTSQGLNLFKKKEWYISAGLGFLSFAPYLIYMGLKFGNPIHVISQGLSSADSSRAEGVTSLDILMEYLRYFPNYTNIIFFLAFLLGAALIFSKMIVSFDKIRKSQTLQKYFFLFLWLVMPLLYFGLFVNHFEDRYLFMIFPVFFILAGFAFEKVRVWLSKNGKTVGMVVIILLLAYGSWASLKHSSNLIESKVSSYDSLRSAGLWLKENSQPGEVVVSSGMPQLTYYSERPVYPYPLNESEFLSFKEEKNASFMVITVWERTPEWTYSWPDLNQEKVEAVQVYYLDEQRTQPSTVIYRFI